MVFVILLRIKSQKIPRMPVYRARTRRRTRQFFAFPSFSPPASYMTIKKRVFLAIMEGKLAVTVRVWLEVRLGVTVRARVRSPGSSPGFYVSLSQSFRLIN